MLDTVREDRGVAAAMKSGPGCDSTPVKSEGRAGKPLRDGEEEGAETRIESRYVDLIPGEVKPDEQEVTPGTVNEEGRSKTDHERSAVPAAACVITHREDEAQQKTSESDGVDNYLAGKSESEDDQEADDDEDDDVSLVLSDDYLPFVKEDESHYITTHEILLSELSDHEGDHDLRVGSSASWDIEEGNQVFTFVDYASLEGGGGASGERAAAPAVSSLLESDPSPASKLTSSDESKPQQCSSTGQIHLSIRATSRAINDSAGSIRERGNILYRARRAEDVSRYVWRGVEGQAEGFDKCLIAAPGRVHFGRKGRELTEYSSGTSSAVSELDDADKEVRNLTARTFKSLAYPYFDAINFSTSSESSASEHGINRWSTFVDLKYGNMSHGLDRNPSFELAKNLDSRGYKGLVLASPKLPELMGKLSQGHGGVIRLTETLNFRCNVKSGMSANFTAGSRSRADEVTRSAHGSQRGKPPLRSMEGAHKKAMFASSLIKNVISKKMQFEQERKMERGEISEPAACAGPQEEAPRGKGGREPQSQTPGPSECSSDYAIMCVDELGDLVDSGSCSSRRQEAEVPASEAAKKGAADASRSTLLLRSQNSAFRSWKDEELGFQKDHKNDKIAEEKPEGESDPPSGTKPTKMSHLFVPNIQLCPGEPQETAAVTQSAGTLSTSKSPEIKINLRSVRDNKTEPFGISRLRAPTLGGKTDESKCPNLLARKGESADKVPHFTVRDFRDNSKGKLQTPIHQVRDVRKLVKSSYHFVSLDNNENRTTDGHLEQKKHRTPSSVSPIIIKCQSVNTNSKAPEPQKSESVDVDRSSPDGAKAAQPSRPAGRSEEAGLRCDSRAAAKKDKLPDVNKSSDVKATNKTALEKLQAAVKTMEQLYVFDNNEWKRKNEPQQLLDSHALSLLATEDHGGPQDDTSAESTVEKIVGIDPHKTPPTVPASPALLRRDDLIKVSHGSGGTDDRFRPVQTGASGPKASASVSTKPKTVTQLPFSGKGFTPKSPKVPQKTSQIKLSGSDGAGSWEKDGSSVNPSVTPVDNGNYLTIPVKSQTSSSKTDKAFTVSSLSQTTTPPGPSGAAARVEDISLPAPQSSSITMETRTPEVPSATIYHSLPLGMSPGQQQVFCFSPAMTPSPTLDPFQATQRKMLLDPTTGNYYLVDTPVQPSTRRLFDPETGQYVDVPMPQTPVTPVTPMPMSISPLALSPGAYGHTYMIYPGFMPAPSVIPARTLVQSQMSVHSDAEGGDKAPSQPVEGLYMDSPIYMSTGKSPQTTPGAPGQSSRAAQGFSSIKQPIISISSQQGPRIIAPPSFDGTTMSFVVEHR